jgi:predicted Zn-dependent protease
MRHPGQHSFEHSPVPDFLSEADCLALMRRVAGFERGGGETRAWIESSWLGDTQWVRNLTSHSGDVRRNALMLRRRFDSVSHDATTNQTDDRSLEETVRRAERAGRLDREPLGRLDLHDDYQEPISHPTIWFDATYHLDAARRAEVVRAAIEPAAQAGMLSAGYLQVSATGWFIGDSHGAIPARYVAFTAAQFSLTVRDPQGTGSGWAGVDWSDWARIDPAHLAAVALDKCLRSRNPVRLEPGRYTAILEPQAVGDLMYKLFDGATMSRHLAEMGQTPFSGAKPGTTKIGERLLDERITITEDPMDPMLGYPPFDVRGEVLNPVTWFKAGVLQQLAYYRSEGIEQFRTNSNQIGSGAFHMTGGETSIDEMIQTTERGLLLTRFSNIELVDHKSALVAGYTRDGLWLVEHGRITKPVKNFRFTESPLFVFNQVEQLGVPQRIFHPQRPHHGEQAGIVAPPAKVRDFSFTSLADAV